MGLSIRTKIVLISSTILFIALGAATTLNSMFFAKEHTKALQSEAFAIAKTLKFQLDRLLALNIALNELVGFEEQCLDLINKHRDISYAMVVDPNGKILFHNDASQHNQVLLDSNILKGIKSQKNVLQMCSMEEDKHYDFFIPVFGSHGEHIAAVRIGFPITIISQKTRAMIAYSVGFAILFLCLGITLLITALNVWVTKPLGKLIAVIQGVRQKGTASSELVEIDSEDELGTLASAFNQMLFQIRKYNQEIKSYTQKLEIKVQERTVALEKINKRLKKDITKREQAEKELKRAYQELKRTQSQLIQSSKLASIGELASGVAHELNQPLMVIRSTAQFFQRELQKDGLSIDELLSHLNPIEKNTKRMMNIINHLRTFSRQSQLKFSRVNINKIMENCFLLIGEQIRLRNIEVKKDLASNLPEIQGDANQLEQVFLNLLTNARDAITLKAESEVAKADLKGRIKIITRIRNSTSDPEGPTPRGEFGLRNETNEESKSTINNQQSQNFVEILIRDNGGGIAAESMEKIFDPFFTTKEPGKGTGLGLSISYGIIKDHGGEIGVDETNSEGTVLKVRLPIED